MKVTPILIWSLAIAATASFATASNVIKKGSPQTYLPQRYLVSIDPKKSPSLKSFQQHLQSLRVDHLVKYDLTKQVPDVFYGASLVIYKEDDVKYLEKSAHVEKITQVRALRRSETFSEKIVNEPLNLTHGFPPHVQTRVSELHKMGIYGQGVKVAVIDSGVDCAHPALGKGFGPGFKLAFGRSYVDDSFDGENVEDSVRPRHSALGIRSKKKKKNEIKSPCTPCSGHGTHVAGIVAAADAGFGFTGVAPNATLGIYRVFDCEADSGSSNDAILAALLQAHKDGADVISASLGQPGGWGWGDELMDAAKKLILTKGVIFTVAAGNEGSEGTFFSDNPASGEGVISVGSVDADAAVAGNFLASTGKQLTLYRPNTFNLTGERPIYLTSNSIDNTRDACDELPKHTPNLTNYVVLIKRGTCTFSKKAEHAAAHGAKWILFYMNSTSLITLSNKLSNASVASISLDDGKYIFNQVKQNHDKFKVSFPPTKHFYVKNPLGGFMSIFSQFGPNFDFGSPQPAVSAVGGNVVSTYPVKRGGYASLSGTSMATPQIAGIAALILSARGKKFTGLELRARMATTAKLLTPPSNYALETVVHQGGGLIDAFCAVWTNTSISTPCLTLKDSPSLLANQQFTIVNKGSRALEYTLTHRPARTIFTFSPKTKDHRPDTEPTFSSDAAIARISPQKFSLSPGSSQVVKVNFTPPNRLDPRLLPIYSGYIVLAGNAECETHNVPYYGVLGSLSKQTIIDRGPIENATAHFPYLTFSKSKKKSSKNATKTAKLTPLNTTFVWDIRKHNTTLYFRILFGSPAMRCDVIAGDAKLSNKPGKSDCEKSFRGTKLLGLLPDSDMTAVSRSASDTQWVLKWNATVIPRGKQVPQYLPNGSYRILMRALHIGGHNTTEANYDYWVSPQFKLKNSPMSKKHKPRSTS